VVWYQISRQKINLINSEYASGIIHFEKFKIYIYIFFFTPSLKNILRIEVRLMFTQFVPPYTCTVLLIVPSEKGTAIMCTPKTEWN
jgi:hypothetical protein